MTIPKVGGGTSAPTGTVFNGGKGFNGDAFLFGSEDGAITGWRPALGTTAEVLHDGTGSDAVYKGLALSTIGSNTYLYASDFHNDQITVLGSSGAPALAGTFTDPNLPAGYAPFNVQNLGGMLYVTFAKQDAAKHDDVAGLGNGYIDVFDLNGNLVKRLVSNGQLDSPWGLALAPSGFRFAPAATCWSATSATGRSTPTIPQAAHSSAPSTPTPVPRWSSRGCGR